MRPSHCICCCMLTVKLKNLSLEFCLGFFLAVGVLAFDSEKAFFRAMIFCFLHEIGHIIAMTLSGVDIKSVKFYSGGIKISADDLEWYSITKRLLIYSAGCTVNFLLVCIMLMFSDYESALINLFLALFNLIPLAHFDGGMILHTLINNSVIEKKLNTVAYIAQAVFALIMLIYSFLVDNYADIVMYILILLCSAFE